MFNIGLFNENIFILKSISKIVMPWNYTMLILYLRSQALFKFEKDDPRGEAEVKERECEQSCSVIRECKLPTWNWRAPVYLLPLLYLNLHSKVQKSGPSWVKSMYVPLNSPIKLSRGKAEIRLPSPVAIFPDRGSQILLCCVIFYPFRLVFSEILTPKRYNL